MEYSTSVAIGHPTFPDTDRKLNLDEEIKIGMLGYLPAGTVAQFSAPGKGAYVPGPQGVHSACLDNEYFPAAHGKHSPSPAALLCVPAGHSVHSLEG